jgi:hypothetical protein
VSSIFHFPAREDVDKAICIAVLTSREWILILKYDFRFALLQEARLRGAQGVTEFMKMLPEDGQRRHFSLETSEATILPRT